MQSMVSELSAAAVAVPVRLPAMVFLWDFRGDCPDFRVNENGIVPFARSRGTIVRSTAPKVECWTCSTHS
jgi:hypothetical protein